MIIRQSECWSIFDNIQLHRKNKRKFFWLFCLINPVRVNPSQNKCSHFMGEMRKQNPPRFKTHEI